MINKQISKIRAEVLDRFRDEVLNQLNDYYENRVWIQIVRQTHDPIREQVVDLRDRVRLQICMSRN